MPKPAPASGSSPEARALVDLTRAIHRLATACEASNRNTAQIAKAVHQQGQAVLSHAESADRLVAAVVQLMDEDPTVVVASDHVDTDLEGDDPGAAPTHYLSGAPINGSGKH